MINAYPIAAWVYEAAPVVALLLTVARVRKSKSVRPVRHYLLVLVSGMLLGLGMVLVRQSLFGGNLSAGQAAWACYWMIGLLWILRAINASSMRFMVRMIRSPWLRRPDHDDAGNAYRRRYPRLAIIGAAALARAGMVFLVGAGLLLATLLGYRPGLTHLGDPSTILHARYESISLRTDDGTRISAWWIAAAAPTPVVADATSTGVHPHHIIVDELNANLGSTILLCHGLGSDKAEQLPAARALYASGYNILAIDLRAHGASGGSISTFGALERLDVLAAVHWLRVNHPADAKHIFGLGINLGSAALLGAAADPGDDGQAIDAIAAIEPFDRAGQVMRDLGDQHQLPSLGWLGQRFAWPALQIEYGALGPSPSADVGMLWPRPLLIVQGEGEGLVSTGRARALFEDALQPKYAWWVDKKNTRQILFKDRRTSLALRAFFGGARSIL